MPRKPRVQFPGAIYHVVTRGDGRRELFHDQGHYQRFTDGLEAEVLRSAWQIIAYCWMPNHIHLLVKTPEPNLSNGMQHWLSGCSYLAMCSISAWLIVAGDVTSSVAEIFCCGFLDSES